MSKFLLTKSFNNISKYCKKNKINVIKRFYSAEEHIIYSRCLDINIPKTSLYEFVCDKIKKWPEQVALECLETGRHYTFNDIYVKSSSLGYFFKEAIKLNDTDTVAVILPNVPEYPIVILGTLLANVTLTTVNPTYTSDEIARQLLNSETKVVITLCDYYPQVSKAIKDSNIKIEKLILIDHFDKKEFPSGTINFKEICNQNNRMSFKSSLYNKTVLLPYSSGTTGLPKGVELSNKNLISNLTQAASREINIVLEATESFRDTIPVFLPFYHIYALVIILLHGMCMGAKLVTIPKFSFENFMKVLTLHKPTVGHFVPPIVLMINTNSSVKSEHLQSLRTVMSGAAPLGGTDIDKFRQKTNKTVFLQSYGMTEMSPLCLMQSLILENGVKPAGCGVLVPHTQAKIVPVTGSTNMGVKPGCSGEIFIKGPQVMKGYYKNEAATNDVLLGDGWLRTGDIGHYDEDGQFFVTDRLKELIKVKGFQVAPAELEEVLRNHPAVKEAAVIGIPHELHGEVPKAFVVLQPDHTFNDKDIQDFVSSKVTTYKRLIGGIKQVDEIPRNPSGKILRRVLKDL